MNLVITFTIFIWYQWWFCDNFLSRSAVWIETEAERAEVWKYTVFGPGFRREGKTTI